MRDSENVCLCLQQEFNFVLKIVQERIQIRIMCHLTHMLLKYFRRTSVKGNMLKL